MKNLLFTLGLILFSTYLFAQPIPIDNRVRMGVLDNGMHYYIQHHEKPENRAEIRLAVKAGAVLEDEDQRGLAHFVEHMAFNGTKNFEKNELVNYLESTGARFGPDLNAYTSFDETVYMLQVRTDDEVILNKGLLIFEDWAGGLLFDPEEIDKERGVVKSEWRSRLSPDQRMQQQYFPVLYKNSLYAQRLPIGDPEIIEHAPYEALERFYRDWYRPDLMAIVIVGDVDVDDMEREVKSRFSKLKNPNNPRKRIRHEVPKHDKTLVSIASDKESSFTSVRMLIKHPHMEINDIPSLRQSLLHRLYNGMMNARLDELTQLPEPPYSFAYTGYGTDLGNIDRFSSFARTGEGQSVECFRAMLTEIERARRFGFTETELMRQKAEVMSSTASAAKELDKTPSNRLAMRYVYHFLENNPIPGPEDRLELYEKFMPEISIDEINKLSEAWLTTANRVIVMTGPEKEGVAKPTEEEVHKVLEEVERQTLEPYEDKIIEGELFEGELTPGSVTEVKTIDEIGVEEWILNNGVRVVLKQTDFKNDEILMRASSEGGHSLYDDTVYPSARFASGIAIESGVSKFDNIQLEKKLTGKIVSVRPYIGETFEGFYGDAAPDDLEILFQLTHLYFTQPRVDRDAQASFTKKQESIFKNLLSNPNYYFSDFVTKLKTNDHPRRGFPTADDLKLIDFDEAMRVYRDRFSDASDFTFYFVGNFDKQKLKEYSTLYLATLPSTNREETWKDVGAHTQDGVIKKTINRGKAPKTQVNMSFHGNMKYTGKNKYLLSSMLSTLRIKLREAMREDKGGVYGVRVSGGNTKIPREQYSITVSFNVEPERAEELMNTAKDVIKKYQSESFAAEDIQKVAETQKQGAIKNLKENSYWMRQLKSAYEDGSDPQNISLEKLEENQKDLTAENLLEYMQQYVDWNNYFEIVMEPEVKPEG